jgi:hypothetical protein
MARNRRMIPITDTHIRERVDALDWHEAGGSTGRTSSMSSAPKISVPWGG